MIMRTVYLGRLLVFAAVGKSERAMANTGDLLSNHLMSYDGKHTNAAWGFIHVAKFQNPPLSFICVIQARGLALCCVMTLVATCGIHDENISIESPAFNPR